ncbi:MAG: acetate--CoA ligase family protein, partial [Solirubrobacteraceae bacterium]
LTGIDQVRRARWRARLAEPAPLSVREQIELLSEYGVVSPASRSVGSRDTCAAAGDELGYPVALKTASPQVAHKTEAGGVLLGIETRDALLRAYDELSGRLGPLATVARMAPPGVELAVGVVRDPVVGPLVVVGAGGTLVELLSDRAVALPPVGREGAARMLARLRVRSLLDGWRGSDPADMGSVLAAVESVAQIAAELGDVLGALEVNPLRCSASGALALDVLVET